VPQNTLKNTGCGKGEAFCEHPFALHLQQREKDMQMSTLPPPGNISANAPLAAASFHNSFNFEACVVF